MKILIAVVGLALSACTVPYSHVRTPSLSCDDVQSNRTCNQPREVPVNFFTPGPGDYYNRSK